MNGTFRKLLVLPVVVAAMTATIGPAQASDSPYSQAGASSDGKAVSTPAGDSIPFCSGGGRKVR